MPKTYKLSINRAIAANNRFGPGRIDAHEARQIHRLISGRDRSRPKPENTMENPEQGPGGEVAGEGESAMSQERFRAGLLALGYNISTAHKLLGMGRSTIYRMSKGETEVPEVVRRLIDMYERFGIPEEHKR